jgi:hypothetical protein
METALPLFIEELYFKRFGRERPGQVFSIEERALQLRQKKAARHEAKRLRSQGKPEGGGDPPSNGAEVKG